MTAGFWTFAFVDLAGFTALTEAHGDESAALYASRFYELTRQSLTGSSRLVKPIGDAVLIAADDPEEAVSSVHALVASVGKETNFPLVRAGIHAGSAVKSEGTNDGEDYFGSGVNLAARVAGLAAGRQVLVTKSVAQALDSVTWQLRPLGHTRFRGLSQPVEVFELIIAVDAEGDVDPVCRMRVPPPAVKASLRHDGQDFIFCSLKCVAAFAADPDQFAHAAVPRNEP